MLPNELMVADVAIDRTLPLWYASDHLPRSRNLFYVHLSTYLRVQTTVLKLSILVTLTISNVGSKNIIAVVPRQQKILSGAVFTTRLA